MGNLIKRKVKSIKIKILLRTSKIFKFRKIIEKDNVKIGKKKKKYSLLVTNRKLKNFEQI